MQRRRKPEGGRAAFPTAAGCRRQDQARIKELGLAVEKLTREVTTRRDELDAEVGELAGSACAHHVRGACCAQGCTTVRELLRRRCAHPHTAWMDLVAGARSVGCRCVQVGERARVAHTCRLPRPRLRRRSWTAPPRTSVACMPSAARLLRRGMTPRPPRGRATRRLPARLRHLRTARSRCGAQRRSWTRTRASSRARWPPTASWRRASRTMRRSWCGGPQAAPRVVVDAA